MSKFIFVDRATGLTYVISAESHGDAIDFAYKLLNEPEFRWVEEIGE